MISQLSYSATNVTTSAYVTLSASTPASCSNLVIIDTSTQLLKIAMGAAGSEIDLGAFQGNGTQFTIPAYIPAGSRLSLKAISASATSGFNVVSFL